MYHPRRLGDRLRLHRERRGLSAYAASRAAGLSINYFRMLETGKARPSASAIASIRDALGLDESEAEELRRLAGLSVIDPAGTPEARAARRAAWPLLTYALVNHLWLPHLELADWLARKFRSAPATVALLRAAAEAPTLGDWLRQAESLTCPKAVHDLIEDAFERLTAPDCQHVDGLANLAKTGEPTSEDELLPITELLSLISPADHGPLGLFGLLSAPFDPVFTVCFFPLFYHEACRTWPFIKVCMRYALHGRDVQRGLYDLVRSGANPADLDAALLDHQRIAGASPQRQPWHAQQWTFPVGDAGSGATMGLAPAPELDAEFDVIFDYVDRCEFLERFPIVKLDAARIADLARVHELPSWQRLRDRAAAPPYAFEPAPERFVSVVGGLRYPKRPASRLLRSLGDAARQAVDGLALATRTEPRRWRDLARLLHAARELARGEDLARAADLAAAFAPNPPAPPGARPASAALSPTAGPAAPPPAHDPAADRVGAPRAPAPPHKHPDEHR